MHRGRNERASGGIDSISHPWRDLRDNERGSAADEDAILISILLPRREGRKKFSDEGGTGMDNAPTFLPLPCELRGSYFETSPRRDEMIFYAADAPLLID